MEYARLMAEKQIYKWEYEESLGKLETEHGELRSRAQDREEELRELRELLLTVLA